MTTSSVLTRIPENTSFLQPTKFQFIVPTLPFLRYFVQTCSVPGISTNAVKVENPFSATYRHGDKLVYESLNITCILDEDFRTFEETYQWLEALTAPQRFPQYIKRKPRGKENAYHDGVLTLLTNANLPNIRITFTDMHPVSISAVQFDTKSNANEHPTIDIVFRYDRYDIERI